MSVAQWVLVGLGIWVVVALVLGRLVARVLRSVGKQDERQHRPGPAQTEAPVDELDAAVPDDTMPTRPDREPDEVARARKRRRRRG